ncbi:MAG: phenylalanine--tRNA ligase subunit beta [Bacteroidales bacterium]|nr:phenylalanine--tRNA ligase subunit beta [Bacteroidales bacterium]
MNISYQWLKQYLTVDLSPEEVAEMLTGCGLEVESMEEWQSVRGGLKGVLIGEVVECKPHPNSDHLSLTKVSVGGAELLPIVCGASNVAAGQKVAVATVGTTIYHGDSELVIQKAKLRGEVSEGMICAEDELGVGTSHDGIMVLDSSAIPGTLASEYFDVAEDVIYQIGLTPNRSDATSHIGVARDITAVYNNFGKDHALSGGRASLNLPDLSAFKPDHTNRSVVVEVEDSQGSPRYSGLTMTNLTVKESPDWLKNRLLSIGLRPINNIVDITNFVLMEFGQPLHAFDADKIKGDKVVVKKYKQETKFTTLDEVERTLTPDDLMICSETDPMCIAGVFGGLNSGVTAETRNIFLESACFNPVSIRKTARHHDLHTDASFRFERGTDIDITLEALKRAAFMIRDIAGGEISSELADIYFYPKPVNRVAVKYSNLNRLIGKVIPRDVVKSILTDLGIIVEKESETGLELIIPAFKVDVNREADVIEEVLRIYGYNNIEIPQEVKSSFSFQSGPEYSRMRNIVGDLLSSNGFFEIMNNSLTTSSYYEDNKVFPAESCVRILNPSSRDLGVMRQTLLYGGLESISYNLNRKASDLLFFETGTVYSLTDPESNDPLPGYHEEQRLALFLTGRKVAESWDTNNDPADQFLLKGILQAIFQRLSIDMHELEHAHTESPLFSNGFTYRIKGETLVTAGNISKSVLSPFDIKQPVLCADLNWDLVMRLTTGKSLQFVDLPKFPVVRRDLALLLDRDISFDQIRLVANETERKLLQQVGLFDVYEGERIEAGKKSYAVSFLFGDASKTLTDAEIDKVMERLVKAFSGKLGAAIR